MKKRIISGIFAALFAVSAVTGISAASDSVFQEEIQDEFQDADDSQIESLLRIAQVLDYNLFLVGRRCGRRFC